MTSTIKVNNVQNQCGQNIINENSNTITIGASGDTIALASGASQSGFGRTGTVDWQTGSIKTAATFSAVNGEGYFVDTSSNAVTANLPAGSAGAIVAFSDYARNFATNKLTVTPNGSEKIGGVAASVFLTVNGQALTLVYVDSTKGWINVQNAEDTEIGEVAAFIAASGGTVLTNGDFKTHIFTGPGTLSVSCGGNAKGSNTVEHAVIAGGGGGSFGGGGGGGFRNTFPSPASGGFAITAGCFSVTVGGGGNGRPVTGTTTAGSNSIFGSITATGGGRAGGITNNSGAGGDGGSGGGGGHGPCGSGASDAGGAGNVPAVSPAQGFNGGTGVQSGSHYGGGGGGGAGAVGGAASSSNPNNVYTGGNGGVGVGIADSNFGPTAPSYGTSGPAGSTRYFGGGGGGAYFYNPGYGAGGAGGGGAAATSGGSPTSAAGTTNTGGGGGGGNGLGKNGGSGIVIIRYKFQ